MISPRFLLPAGLLLALALVPTVIHHYMATISYDGLTVEAVNGLSGNYTVESTDRRGTWVAETFASTDWLENRYTSTAGEQVLLFVARSYDLKRLYHHPEIGILRGVDLEREKLISTAGLPDVPVHFMRERDNTGAAAYVILYDGEFVGNPIVMQLKSSLKMLFSAGKPLTLFFVYDRSLQGDAEFDTSPAAHVLAEAVRMFSLQRPDS